MVCNSILFTISNGAKLIILSPQAVVENVVNNFLIVSYLQRFQQRRDNINNFIRPVKEKN